MALNTRNITKEIIDHLDPAPWPDVGTLLEARMGKVSTLGNKSLGEEPSGIYKKKLQGQVFVSRTGLTGDEHVYHTHGGTERAVNQYASGHYADWRCEDAPKTELFQFGGFGENLVGTNMTEDNVCIGDLYRVGKDVVLQVSEPRSPCNKLNKRFQWPRALKRVQRTGRVGWNYRVLKTGYMEQGDSIVLIERPYPKWSLINVKRIIQAKKVPLDLIQELTELDMLTDQLRGYAANRLESTPKTYELVEAKYVTSRVKQLTFELKESITLRRPELHDFAFAQIAFGQDLEIKRSYSFVQGDMNRFSLGVALDGHSRGGSAYLHNTLKVGDQIQMFPGGSPKSIVNEEKCIKEDCVDQRVIIIGGIGVTAFLPIVAKWEADGTPYEIHYACRSPEDAPYLDRFEPSKTTVYAKSNNKRLNIDDVITPKSATGEYRRKIYCCGPTALMDACKKRAQKLEYPEHMLHFESFGADSSGSGAPFEADVHDLDSGRSTSLKVPSDKTLLQALRDAGFDMTSFCEMGGCGACKVTVCSGKTKHNGEGLAADEKDSAMLSCVDRGIGRIEIELD